MKQIESVLIIGAGALGLLYMEPLNRVLGDSCRFLASGERGRSLKEREFLINGEPRRFPSALPEELTGPADLIIVAVKNYHLEQTAPLIRASAGKNTVIVSVLNGIESEEFLARLVPEAAVLPCAVLGMDAVKEGNGLSFTSRGRFLVGTGDNNPDHPALRAFTALLDRAGLAYRVPEDIHREIWYKWMINIGINQVSAVTGADYGEFQRGNEAHALMKAAMEEVITLARAEGINLAAGDLNTWETVLHSLGPEGKTSMLQDMEAGRKTEVESFAGKLITLAEKHSLDTPVNRTLYRIIRVRERRA